MNHRRTLARPEPERAGRTRLGTDPTQRAHQDSSVTRNTSSIVV